MVEEMKCTSCSVNLLGDNKYVKFKCPNCLKAVIFRCSRCKRLSNEYKCSNCAFVGP